MLPPVASLKHLCSQLQWVLFLVVLLVLCVAGVLQAVCYVHAAVVGVSARIAHTICAAACVILGWHYCFEGVHCALSLHVMLMQHQLVWLQAAVAMSAGLGLHGVHKPVFMAGMCCRGRHNVVMGVAQAMYPSACRYRAVSYLHSCFLWGTSLTSLSHNVGECLLEPQHNKGHIGCVCFGRVLMHAMMCLKYSSFRHHWPWLACHGVILGSRFTCCCTMLAGQS